MVIELFQYDAQKTVTNFVDLAEQGFYNGSPNLVCRITILSEISVCA